MNYEKDDHVQELGNFFRWTMIYGEGVKVIKNSYIQPRVYLPCFEETNIEEFIHCQNQIKPLGCMAFETLIRHTYKQVRIYSECSDASSSEEDCEVKEIVNKRYNEVFYAYKFLRKINIYPNLKFIVEARKTGQYYKLKEMTYKDILRFIWHQRSLRELRILTEHCDCEDTCLNRYREYQKICKAEYEEEQRKKKEIEERNKKFNMKRQISEFENDIKKKRKDK